MEWLYLLIAGIFETGWAIAMKYSEGFTKFYPTLFTAISLFLSMYLLEKALKVIPVGTGYAIWTGIGIIGTTLLGILLFGEATNIGRLACIMLIVFGIIGLKLM
ncbi:MAG: multidrug efflux SMR transporter [Methanosarcinaceae archaeon]|nr:multidrug efflux SMR transporter [Methanosarcinaceae archaeon]MDD4749096.1 multidrug efflux SMR transporter [Methanosarcinaceae archaeon]